MKPLLAALLLTTAISLAPPAAADVNVTYAVQSDGPLLSVVYFDALNNEVMLNNQPASWTQTVNSRSTYPMTSMSAQTTGTQVACQIKINGQVRDQKSATGRYAVTTCSA